MNPSSRSRLVLLGLAALALVNVACAGSVGAGPATPVPTEQIAPGFKPGDTPAPTTTRATLVPGDPAMPVSNETPVTPKPVAGRVRVQLVVTDATSGAPIARARIGIPKASVPVPEIAYLTDAQGQATLNLPPGDFTIAVFADQYASAERTVSTRGESSVELKFELKKL